MAGPKIVKRYANRKLYDTERSCYVTLDDISLMIRSGEDVKVIDNKSGEDLTSVTLAQIIFETEKKHHFMPLNLLRGLIQNSGGAIGEFAREQVETVQTRAQEVQGQVTGLTEKVKNQWEEKLNKQQTEVKDAFSSTQKNFDDFQKNVEERIQGGVDAVGQNIKTELDEIRKRLNELKERIRN